MYRVVLVVDNVPIETTYYTREEAMRELLCSFDGDNCEAACISRVTSDNDHKSPELVTYEERYGIA